MKSRLLLFLLLALLVAGCNTHPLHRSMEQRLQEQLMTTARAYLDGAGPQQVMIVDRPVSDVESKLSEQRRAQLDAISGPEAYRDQPLDLGVDLKNRTEPPVIAMSLRRALHDAVRHNLSIQIARLQPAVDEALIVQAESLFDAVYFAQLNYQDLDSPRPTPSNPALGFLGSNQQELLSFTTGIRKPLTTGGQVALQTNLTRDFSKPSSFAEDGEGFKYYTSNVEFSVRQPVLRNFGTELNRSQIMLARHARAESVNDLHARMMELVQITEETYWALVFARQKLLIQTRLLHRTTEDRDRIAQRREFDVTPAQITEANSFVESRRAEVVRARQDVRRASDELKRLINAPDTTVADETLIVPMETPVNMPIQFSLLDAVTTALQRRPELQRALYEIEDAAIRQRVADNQRLPVLNLIGAIRYNGVGNGGVDAYEQLEDMNFIDYILGLEFEYPLGNRQADALVQQRKLERRASVINYQRLAQNVVVEVKNALRNLLMEYELIGAERAARRAAAENLRALDEQERAGEALTPEFLDYKLRRQEALANAELREMQAMVDYNIAISSYYRTMGTLLERNGIEFNPTPPTE